MTTASPSLSRGPQRWLTCFVAPVLAVTLWCVSAGAQESSVAVAVDDGAAITPEFARSLFDRVKELGTPDGCRLVRFDTSRFRITIGWQTPAGAQHAVELSTARPVAGARRAGGWSLAVSADAERDCAASVAAIEQVLGITDTPRSRVEFTSTTLSAMLAGAFVLLVIGTALILAREARRQPVPIAMLLLCCVWLSALALRLVLSPRTFLHEYYHIAETVPAYLTGRISPLYGQTGPALFRFVGALVGQPDNVQVIFVTNAVLASLAIPALALLDLALLRSWPRALCAAVLLCVLPHHLRFSAAEDLFVMTVTFGLWSLALFALYLRTQRWLDALCGALALALAMQVRPEMLFFPLVLVAMAVLVQPRSWRVLVAPRTWVALLVVAALVLPRIVELQSVMQEGPAPPPMIPDVSRYLDHLVLLQPHVTPPLYWVALAVGAAWSAWRQRGLLLWASAVFVGYTLFSMSLFDNPPYNLRSQILPASLLMLIAAGVAPVWLALWGRQQRRALVVGGCLLAGSAVAVVAGARGFVTALYDQQREWSFLARAVPALPEGGTLVSVIEGGGRNLDAFPQFLLEQAKKNFTTVDLRRALSGDARWPAPGADVIFYQGMFCYFAFHEEEPPIPMTALCRAVHDRYVVEPVLTEDLETQGYSHLDYAPPPYRIGFYRLAALR